MKARFIISGLVQGVCFRISTLDQARQLGLAGEVSNLPSGQVEILVEGAPEKVEALRLWAEHGPSGAQVTGVKFFPGQGPGGYQNFRITG